MNQRLRKWVSFGVALVLPFAFYRLHRTAGLLLIPYLLWVTYAATLNAGIVALN